MKRTVSRKVRGTASVMIILVLVFGGLIYLRTASIAQEIDNRNLRELSRIGEGVEGRINNLQSVLKSLAEAKNNDQDASEDSLRSRFVRESQLITPLTIKDESIDNIEENDSARVSLKIDLSDEVFQLYYPELQDSEQNIIPVTYDFSAIRPALSSDFMETVFLANEQGTVFMWESERAGIRIDELASLDTLHFKSDGENNGIGATDIIEAPIAGQQYRFYLLPIRINLSEVNGQDGNPDSKSTKWILGGMVPQTNYQQQSLSLGPRTALLLGFIVIIGSLLIPFLRVFTMGHKERLRVGQLLYLVIALIFGAGLIGLYLSDIVHYGPLVENLREEMNKTANTMAFNLDTELQRALQEINQQTNSLNSVVDSVGVDFFDLDIGDLDPDIRMKDSLKFDVAGTYPFYHMVFWTDSVGMQIAKWTPRSQNTPRIDVKGREYFSSIMEDKAWPQSFQVDPGFSTCDDENPKESGSDPYYIESIRSYTTGEYLAAISIPWRDSAGQRGGKRGIAAITTELASLSEPVLPVGTGFAVLDANARTLFHSRPERILDENFAEETGNSDLFRSILAARTCSDLELSYGGSNKLMVVRPLSDRPLFLVVYKDLSMIDTVRFEAWFEGGVLFSLWVIHILILIFLLDRVTSSRLIWLWPDLDKPGRYSAYIIMSLPFLFLLLFYAVGHHQFNIQRATLLLPALYLGLGLVVLSWGNMTNARVYEKWVGWLLFISAGIALLLFLIRDEFKPYGEIAVVTISLFFVIIWLRSSRKSNIMEKRNALDKWALDISPRLMYTAAMVSGLLILGILPGYLTYRFTFHDHSEHLVKYHQLELSEALLDRKVRIDELMQNTWCIDDWRELEAHVLALSVHTYDMAYNNLIFHTNIEEEELTDESEHEHTSNLHNVMHGFLGNQIPFLSEASVMMRQLSAHQEGREWVDNHEKNVLQLQIRGQEPITSRVPIVGNWLDSGRMILPVLVLIFLFLIVYRVGRWIFFIHLEHSEPLSLEDVLPEKGEKWEAMILVGTRSISRKALISRSDVYYVNLITEAHKSGKLPHLQIPENIKAICLDFFDYRIHSKDRNLSMLELLENNLFREESLPLILMTSRDLDELLFAEDAEDEIKGRWERVLGRFAKVILSDNVSSHPFEEFVQQKLIRKISRDINKQVDSVRKLTEMKDVNIKAKEKNELREELFEINLRIKWLREELDKTDAIEELVTQTSHAVEGIVEKIRAKIKDLKDLEKLLSEVEQNSKKIRIEKLHSDSDEKGKRILLTILAWCKDKVSFFGKWLSMWIIPTAGMTAERTLFREKRNIRVVYNAIVEECGHHGRLHAIGKQILNRPDWFRLKQEEVVKLVGEAAQNYYAARWEILSQGEQLVAAQLSRGAVINPKSHKATTRLYARGLIKRNPELQLDNKSFADFIENQVSSDQLLKWERAGIPSTWELIRGPIVIGLIIIALFLFWSQREFLGNTVAFLGTIGVGLGAILNLLSKLERGSGFSEMKNQN